MENSDTGGYSVTYSRSEIQFPVYVVALLAAAFLAAAFVTHYITWWVLGLVTAGIAYYNYPLLETKRPTLGANQYGVFIQGFGLIRWRAIDKIEMVEIAERANIVHELHITLNMLLSQALVIDWRKQPFWRSLMRLPWSMGVGNVIRVTIDPFNDDPGEIHRTLTRMWRFYRS